MLRRVGRRVEERHADEIVRVEPWLASARASGWSPLRFDESRALGAASPVELGRSATRSSSTISSPTRAAPALIVEMTSMPGWDGGTSAGVISGLLASRAPIGTATHSPGRAWVGRFAGVEASSSRMTFDEPGARSSAT